MSKSTSPESVPVAINGHPLPVEMLAAINVGEWMTSLSKAAGARFGLDTNHRTVFYDYNQMVLGTSFFASPEASPFWQYPPSQPDPMLIADPAKSVLICELVEYKENYLLLDYRSEPPCVRLLTDAGWELVANSIADLIEQLASTIT